MDLKELAKQLPNALKNIKFKDLKSTNELPEHHHRLIDDQLPSLVSAAIEDDDEPLENLIDPNGLGQIGFEIYSSQTGHTSCIAEVNIWKGEHTEDGRPHLDIDIKAYMVTHQLHVCFDWAGKTLKPIDVTEEDAMTHEACIQGAATFMAEILPDNLKPKGVGTTLKKTDIRKLAGNVHEVSFTFIDENNSLLEVNTILTGGDMVKLASHLLNRNPDDLLNAISTIEPKT